MRTQEKGGAAADPPRCLVGRRCGPLSPPPPVWRAATKCKPPVAFPRERVLLRCDRSGSIAHDGEPDSGGRWLAERPSRAHCGRRIGARYLPGCVISTGRRQPDEAILDVDAPASDGRHVGRFDKAVPGLSDERSTQWFERLSFSPQPSSRWWPVAPLRRVLRPETPVITTGGQAASAIPR